jgi:hypothetical protein
LKYLHRGKALASRDPKQRSDDIRVHRATVERWEEERTVVVHKAFAFTDIRRELPYPIWIDVRIQWNADGRKNEPREEKADAACHKRYEECSLEAQTGIHSQVYHTEQERWSTQRSSLPRRSSSLRISTHAA